MYVPVSIEISDGQFVGIQSYLHIFRLIEGQIKSLLVFYADNFAQNILSKHVVVIFTIKMEYLLNQRPPLEHQFVYLHLSVVDKNTHPMSLMRVVKEGHLHDDPANFVSDLVFGSTLYEDGSN